MINNIGEKAKVGLLAQIKKEIEDHYSDKFIYALPNWAKLTGKPEIIAIVKIHGENGIAITKKRVDFHVDFESENSICNYAHFLNAQMDITLEIKGYVVFYVKNICIVKDSYYDKDLTDSEVTEMTKFNVDNKLMEILCMKFTKDFGKVDLDFVSY